MGTGGEIQHSQIMVQQGSRVSNGNARHTDTVASLIWAFASCCFLKGRTDLTEGEQRLVDFTSSCYLKLYS